jgi:hypothetical protein
MTETAMGITRFFTGKDLCVFQGPKIAKKKKGCCVEQQPFRQKPKDFDHCEIAVSLKNPV